MAMHEEKLEKARETVKEGSEAARKVTAEINRAVRDNPWPFISAAAVLSFLLGFFVRGSRKD